MLIESVHTSRLVVTSVVVALSTGLLSCRGSDATPDTAEMVTEVVEGECRDVFGAEVCTWATFSETGLLEFGVTLPLESVENVPETMAMVWPPAPMAILALPDGVEEFSGFSHFELNWEHHGHPPETFSTPHFDFHFYTIPTENISEIDCKDLTKPDELPAGYSLPDAIDPDRRLLTGLCVPSMGMHAMHTDDLENAEPFTATMLIGYYQQEVIFIEPMVSRARLLESTGFSLEVPSLPASETVRYPAHFRAEFDESSRTYRMAFSDFGAR